MVRILPEMKRLLPDALFTGYLRGEELAECLCLGGLLCLSEHDGYFRECRP